MKTIFILLTVIVFAFQLHAQTPEIVWQNNFGGSNDDFGHSFFKTDDGGIILAGTTKSNDGNVTGNHGGYDCWIIKLDMNYNVEWQKCYGGSDNDYSFSIVQTSDNGYVFTGGSSSSDGDLTYNYGGSDIWVVKLNPTGVIVWQKSVGGPFEDIGWNVIETTTGDIVVAGKFQNPGNLDDDKAQIIKLSSTGEMQWEKYFGGSLWENAKHIIQTNDGGFVFVGEAYSNDGDLTGNYGCSDCWIVKLTTQGNIEWQKNLGGSHFDYAECVIENCDGSYTMSGHTQSNDFNVTGNHGELDAWIVKLSSTGELIWQKCYGGSEYEQAKSIIRKSNSGYIFSGSTNSNDGDVSGLLGSSDFWIVETDTTGEIVWQQCLGGSQEDYSFQIENAGFNQYLLIGVSASTDFYVTGNNGGRDYWVIKIDTEVGIVESSNSNETFIYPNPSNGFITIQSKAKLVVEIRNILGEKILFNEIHGKGFLDLSSHPKGVYVIHLTDQSNKTVDTKKILIN